jgi:hypothetical protein
MLIGGAIALCLLSFVTSFIWARLKFTWAALICAVVFPVLAAWPIYWLPLSNVRDTSEYSSWYGVFLISWLVYALPVSIVATLLVRRKARQRASNAG